MVLETFSLEARPRVCLKLPELLPSGTDTQVVQPFLPTNRSADAQKSRLALVWDELVAGRLSIAAHRVDEASVSLSLTASEPREPSPERALRAEILEGALTGRAQKITALDHRLMPSTLSLWMSCTLRDMGFDCCVRQAPLGLAMLAFVHAEQQRALPPGYHLVSMTSSRSLELEMPRPEPALRERLSPCEYEVVRQVIAGASYLQVGSARGVSPRTVANQLRSASCKLGVIGRFQWLSLAMRLSWERHAAT